MGKKMTIDEMISNANEKGWADENFTALQKKYENLQKAIDECGKSDDELKRNSVTKLQSSLKIAGQNLVSYYNELHKQNLTDEEKQKRAEWKKKMDDARAKKKTNKDEDDEKNPKWWKFGIF